MKRLLEREVKKTVKRPMKPVDDMTALLIQELMNASTSFHKLHLQVTGPGSFAQHMALGNLYEALPGLADTIAEGYQGACEIILQFPPKSPIALSSVDEAVDYMRGISEAVKDLQSVMPHSEIVNQLDLVKDAINTAKYKLLFLS